MILANAEILQLLRAKGVTDYYHANSVTTACTFLENGALLSRAYVETRRFRQTPQSSDDVDKRYGIWGDVFVDGVDIHARARTASDYGPVMFVLNIESVLSDPALSYTLRITRDNPIYWSNGQSEADRYYTTPAEFNEQYRFGDFKRMFTFRIRDGRLPLIPHLRRVVLDNPDVPAGSTATSDTAITALRHAAQRGGVAIEITRRTCPPNCKCRDIYRNNWARKFAPLFAI